MISCCWCGRACSIGNERRVGPERIVFCLSCGVMMLTVERHWELATRPLTLAELAVQLQDAETLAILRQVEGARRHA